MRFSLYKGRRYYFAIFAFIWQTINFIIIHESPARMSRDTKLVCQPATIFRELLSIFFHYGFFASSLNRMIFFLLFVPFNLWCLSHFSFYNRSQIS